MGAFTDVSLNWRGKDYEIRASRMMGAIARIEDVVTLPELQRCAARKTAPLGKVAQAFAAVLRYAGAEVTDEDVYLGMFGARGGVAVDVAMTSLMTLMAMMVPPASLQAKGAPQPGNVKPAAGAKSKRRSSSRSARGE